MMTSKQAEERLRQIAGEIDFLENTIRTLSWDMRVNLPEDAGEYRGKTIGFLTSEVLKRKTSQEMAEILDSLNVPEPADTPVSPDAGDEVVLSAMVRKFRREYKYLKEVPAELNAAYAAHNLQCEIIWQKARATNDYALLMPWMEKEFAYLRDIASAHGYTDDPLTGLMSAGDPGLTREKVDALFAELKAFELPFLEQLKASSYQPQKLVLPGSFPADTQKALCEDVMSTVGFNFRRGRVDVSAHPYTTANDSCDIRFTTRYFPDSFLPALNSCMHEGGHGMHAQHAHPSLRYTTLENAPYDAICESQSRYMENIIGLSLPYWEFCLPVAMRYFPQLKGLTPRQIYESQACLQFSENRMKSDELTYNLHIIIRYELEKELFDGTLSFRDLPEAWNRKYQEYLGVTPQNDAVGVMQDMHWSSGYIGYFQSYVMGNFYDGHYLASMRRDVPDMYEQVRKGNFAPVTGWLRDHVQQYGGMYTPAELLRGIDGETLTARHYIDYIRDKYTEIYRL